MTLHLKKNLLFAAYLLFNIGLMALLQTISYGYLIVALFVAGGHVRDVLSVIYQVFNMKKILRRCPDIVDDEQRSSTICCLVSVYNEEPIMLKKNLDALTTQNLSANTKVLVMLLFDGLAEHNIELYDSVV